MGTEEESRSWISTAAPGIADDEEVEVVLEKTTKNG